MQVSKWGNSLAVRLPATVALQMGLKEGDDLKIEAINTRSLTLVRQETREEALAGIRAMRVKLPEGWKFDREEANER